MTGKHLAVVLAAIGFLATAAAGQAKAEVLDSDREQFRRPVRRIKAEGAVGMNFRNFVLFVGVVSLLPASGTFAMAETIDVVCQAPGPNLPAEYNIDLDNKTAEMVASGTIAQNGGPAPIAIAGSVISWKVPLPQDPTHASYLLQSLNRSTGTLTIQICGNSGCQPPAETDPCQKASNKF